MCVQEFVPHGSDIQLMFPSLMAAVRVRSSLSDAETTLRNTIALAWANFVKTGCVCVTFVYISIIIIIIIIEVQICPMQYQTFDGQKYHQM
jgi:hypothetical protein